MSLLGENDGRYVCSVELDVAAVGMGVAGDTPVVSESPPSMR